MRRRRTGIGWLGGLLVDIALLAALASFVFASSDSKLLCDVYYVDEIELNTCGEVGFERSYYIYRGYDGLIVAWSNGIAANEPARSANGKYIAIVEADGGKVIVHANSYTWSRTEFDVELHERAHEEKIRHKRHNFSRKRKDLPGVLVPPVIAP